MGTFGAQTFSWNGALGVDGSHRVLRRSINDRHSDSKNGCTGFGFDIACLTGVHLAAVVPLLMFARDIKIVWGLVLLEDCVALVSSVLFSYPALAVLVCRSVTCFFKFVFLDTLILHFF